MFNFSNIFLLKGLSEKEQNEIITLFPPIIDFQKGEIIYSNTKFSKAIGFIFSGTALAVTNNHHKIVMNKFSEGMCFGAAALFGNHNHYVSTVTSQTDCQVLFIHEELLTVIFKSYPETAINYITFLTERIRFLNEKLSVISCSTAEDTVHNYLLSAVDSEGYAQIPKSMTMLAKMLGLGRASLYRSLDTLESNGVIIREKNKIKVIQL